MEAALARARSVQIPLNPAVAAPGNVPNLSSIRVMRVDFNDVGAKMEAALAFSRELFNQ